MHRLLYSFCSLCLLVLSACSPTLTPSLTQASASPALLYLRADSPTEHYQLIMRDNQDAPSVPLPFNIPGECSIWGLHAAPVGGMLAVELDCGYGSVVLTFNPANGETFAPAQYFEVDNHFLAWASDGQTLYLRIDSLGNSRIVRVAVDGSTPAVLPLPTTVYDLAVLPDGHIIYSLTLGVGFGAETWLADLQGEHPQRLITERHHIIAFARPSPQGDQIAYIRMPDSITPFTIGELWVVNADGSNSSLLAYADAGHGYAPVWSPDGTKIAFVVRENPDNIEANTSPAALVSNIYVVDVETGSTMPATSFPQALVETPTWSPDGTQLAFNVLGNGTISVWLAELSKGTLQRIDEVAFSCCAVWFFKR